MRCDSKNLVDKTLIARIAKEKKRDRERGRANNPFWLPVLP